jgi:uncharacterized protein (TIGR03435 family)
MRPAILCAGLIIFTSCGVFAQAAAESPTFEVASVKPAEAPSGMGMMRVMMRGGPGSPDPGQITYSNVSLKNILMNAYAVKGYQISGPKWLDSERFDIVAKIPKGATKEQFQVMLQNLLAERFKLTLHHETKELPMYALVVGKGGPKLKESVDEDASAAGAQGGASGPGGPSASAPPPPPPPPPGSDGAGPAMSRIKVGQDGMPQLPPGMGKNGLMMMMMNGRMRMVGNRQPITAVTEMLGNQLGRPVVDATELKAKYDFTLDFAPDGLNGPMGPMGMMPPPALLHEGGPGGGAPVASAPESGGPTIFTALQEQLGLKLEQKKGPVDLLVIDRLEKVPTEN